MIFYNHLYIDILKYIIEYIYKFNNNIRYDKYNNNEIIIYSLVSKSWFKIVSALLLDVLDESNYNHFKSLIYNSIDNNNNNNINNNNNNNNENSNKLIKNNKIYHIKDIYIISIQQLKSLCQQYQRVLIDYYSPIIGLNKSKEYPSNCELNYYLENSREEYNNMEIYNCNKVNHIWLEQFAENYNLSTYGDTLRKLQPNQISNWSINEMEDHEFFQHVDHSELFQLKSLESLSFSGVDHVEPRAVSILDNQFTKLKSLSLSMVFHQIVKKIACNYNEDFQDDIYYADSMDECNEQIGCLLYQDSIYDDWVSMIKVLSNNKTIQRLEFINPCDKLKCSYGYDSSIISPTFKSLFQTNSTITSLVLKDLDFLNTTILEGIANNKSIISLELKERIKVGNSALNMEYKQNQFNNYKYLFNNVLAINKTIQNISITWHSSSKDQLFKLLDQSKLNINLQSLSIYISNNISKKDTVNKIISLSLQIIEINITKQTPHSFRYKTEKILNNKSIFSFK